MTPTQWERPKTVISENSLRRFQHPSTNSIVPRSQNKNVADSRVAFGFTEKLCMERIQVLNFVDIVCFSPGYYAKATKQNVPLQSAQIDLQKMSPAVDIADIIDSKALEFSLNINKSKSTLCVVPSNKLRI